MDPATQRARLTALVDARGTSLAECSRMLGRNAAYLQQFVARGTPRLLAESDRGRLARYLGVAETELGGPTPGGAVAVPRIDVGASAGPGALAEGDVRARTMPFDPALLRLLGVRAEAASLIRIAGESMEPTLHAGDEVLVDRDRRTPGGRAALFVLRFDGALIAKRVRAIGAELEIASDNPAYPRWFCPRGTAEVIGRVVWLGRALL